MKRTFFSLLMVSLTAATAFAFTNSKAFATAGLYADLGNGNYKQISDQPGVTAPNGSNVSTTTSFPALTIVSGSSSYNIVYDNGSGTRTQVHTDGSW